MTQSAPHLNTQSLAWHHRSQSILVGGGQAHRRTHKYTLRGGPEFAQRASGAYFWDVDGHRYIDYLMAYGPILLGHADQRVNAAVSQQMADGVLYSVEHPKVVELAERLCGLIPCAERATFLVGGSSATLAAIRCARVHTGRERVVRCGYHGWFDWCFPGDPGSPSAMSELVTAVNYNDLNQLATICARDGDQIAAIIIEGFLADGPTPHYLAGVRDLCDRYGIVFILDEVKTGFRFGLGGAQAALGAQPDLATFGKAMANGWPGSVLVGRAHILNGRSDTFIGATFHGDLMTVAAANTVIDVIQHSDGLERIQRLGTQLLEGVDAAFESLGFPLQMRGHPVMPEVIQCDPNHPTRSLPDAWHGKVITEWCAAMMRRGIFVTGHVWFLSFAHTISDIEETIAAAYAAAQEASEILAIGSELPYVG